MAAFLRNSISYNNSNPHFEKYIPFRSQTCSYAVCLPHLSFKIYADTVCQTQITKRPLFNM